MDNKVMTPKPKTYDLTPLIIRENLILSNHKVSQIVDFKFLIDTNSVGAIVSPTLSRKPINNHLKMWNIKYLIYMFNDIKQKPKIARCSYENTDEIIPRKNDAETQKAQSNSIPSKNNSIKISYENRSSAAQSRSRPLMRKPESTTNRDFLFFQTNYSSKKTPIFLKKIAIQYEIYIEKMKRKLQNRWYLKIKPCFDNAFVPGPSAAKTPEFLQEFELRQFSFQGKSRSGFGFELQGKRAEVEPDGEAEKFANGQDFWILEFEIEIETFCPSSEAQRPWLQLICLLHQQGRRMPIQIYFFRLCLW